MESHKYLDESVDQKKSAKLSKNHTGAEITAVVKSALSFALERKVRTEKKKEGNKIDVVGGDNINFYMNDFMRALEEVKPAFGINEDDFTRFEKPFYEIPSLKKSFLLGQA